MVRVSRFRGFLAAQEHADKVIAPPYDVLNTQEALEMAKDNEKSFLHVNKPEIDLPAGTNPYDDSVYQKGRDNLLQFCENGWLKQDETAQMYVYTMHMGEHVQHGLMCLSSVDDYEQNIIKKHEKTVERKEIDRTKLTNIQSANIGPVFLTYLGGDEITQKISRIYDSTEAYSEVTTDDGIKHILHRVSEADCEFFEKEFEKIPATYVADGHHRTQAAYNVGRMRKQAAIEAGHEVKGDEAFNFFMTLIVPGTEIKCYEYNRLVKTLEGNTSAQFLEKMGENFEITELPEGASTRPAEVHTINLLLEEKWYACKIKPELIDEDDAVKRLDSYLLTELCLKPILGIENLRTDRRIEFSGGIRGDQELVRRCNLDCAAAFAMKEIGVEDLLRVADSGEQMPPKSTWFEPKPRSGFVVRCFD